MGFAKPIEQYLFGNLLTKMHVFMYLKDIIRGMMDMQLVTELKDSLHNYDGGLAIERRDSGRIKH